MIFFGKAHPLKRGHDGWIVDLSVPQRVVCQSDLLWSYTRFKLYAASQQLPCPSQILGEYHCASPAIVADSDWKGASNRPMAL